VLGRLLLYILFLLGAGVVVNECGLSGFWSRARGVRRPSEGKSKCLTSTFDILGLENDGNNSNHSVLNVVSVKGIGCMFEMS
jgi:hypothetical protein